MWVKKVGYAFLYAFFSFLMTVVNKIVLTSCHFPSPMFLVVTQFLMTLVLISVGKMAGLMRIQRFGLMDAFLTINPLPFLYLGNAITGLEGTKGLSIPMYSALRRFGVPITMIGEYFVFGKRTSIGIQISIYLMLAGSCLAALRDLTFSLSAYTVLMLNNVITTFNDIIVKIKLDETNFGTLDILYYNALFMLIPAILTAYLFGEFHKALDFDGWWDGYFLTNFLLSCLLSFFHMYSAVQCTNYNSPLTTSIVGTIKNIAATYIGVWVGGDYVFEIYNFIGINLSVLGSLLYTVVVIVDG